MYLVNVSIVSIESKILGNAYIDPICVLNRKKKNYFQILERKHIFR